MLINIFVSIKCGMIFINEIKISDIISIISLIMVIVGGIFGYYQWSIMENLLIGTIVSAFPTIQRMEHNRKVL